MSQTDPIADMLTRIRNAAKAGLATVEMPHARLKSDIARLLKREGYITDFVAEAPEGRKVLRVYLKYGPGRVSVIRGLRRISKPGLRRYAATRSLPRVMGGMGVAILSTSKGVLTDRECRTEKLGGEVLCHVW